MLELRFDVLGEQQYARRFDTFGRQLDDLKEPLGRVRDRLVETVGQQFQQEGAHGGAGPWQPLNPEYEAWKADAFPGRPMLVQTGAMRAAYLQDGTRELTQRALVWGVDNQVDADGQPIADRARAHQAGLGNMPQRKIVQLRSDDQRVFDRVFVEWINYQRQRLLG